ncbi:ArsR/SmtB family transcription factor [Chryseolinea lacunae]|uniref:Winged helix-turn-helix transcriptional regulator n=1 Tax=Chryseolinea lacunae TaxID=2801331 RepID=A0ABS1KK43_9BACT|nr:metalloregulator ArsR/SmtB family transcription factor [Chryseolinea lacunae]MBL0739809.1 winged helix-turn-helix transcriptional regulator [Chryseolinea lacunae]
MKARRDVFQAIADPTRRQIIHMLADKPLNLNSIAEQFDMKRQSIATHIKILTECGLLVVRQQGRERFCEARLQTLHEVSSWVDQYKKFWHQQFASLEKYLDKVQTMPARKSPTRESSVSKSPKGKTTKGKATKSRKK